MSAGSITALVETLVAAGCTPDMILAAVRTAEATKDDALGKSREKTRNRVKKWRAARVVTLPGVTERSVPTHASASPAPDLENKQTNKQDNKIDASPSAQPKRGTLLPEDFAPDLAWATAQGLSLSEAQTEAAQFKDFWSAKAGKDALKVNWPAAWRMWIRNYLKRRATAPPKRAAPAETVGSLSLNQLFRPRNETDVADHPAGRVEASGPRRLEARAGPSQTFTVTGDILGRI